MLPEARHWHPAGWGPDGDWREGNQPERRTEATSQRGQGYVLWQGYYRSGREKSLSWINVCEEVVFLFKRKWCLLIITGTWYYRSSELEIFDWHRLKFWNVCFELSTFFSAHLVTRLSNRSKNFRMKFANEGLDEQSWILGPPVEKLGRLQELYGYHW